MRLPLFIHFKFATSRTLCYEIALSSLFSNGRLQYNDFHIRIQKNGWISWASAFPISWFVEKTNAKAWAFMKLKHGRQYKTLFVACIRLFILVSCSKSSCLCALLRVVWIEAFHTREGSEEDKQPLYTFKTWNTVRAGWVSGDRISYAVFINSSAGIESRSWQGRNFSLTTFLYSFSYGVCCASSLIAVQ